jgi:DNA polymerase I-like protein with 3'-5' exonuclease and polymerase domains
MIEMFRKDRRADFHQMIANLCGQPRDQTKPLALGRVYGMGDAKVCRTLGFPVAYCIKGDYQNKYSTREEAEQVAIDNAIVINGLVVIKPVYDCAGEEGQKFIDKFNASVPFLNEVITKFKSIAKKQGFIRTIKGRKCRFPLGKYGEYDFLHKALNKGIQGSAGDQTKEAMVACDNYGIDLRLQVHDDLGFYFLEDEEAYAVERMMCNVVKLEVPSAVTLKAGPSWGEIDELQLRT